jgi:uncharacterized membrane protein YvbJ
MPFCTECGGQHEANDKFCALCGTRLEIDNEIQSKEKKSLKIPSGLSFGLNFDPLINCYNCGTRKAARVKICTLCRADFLLSIKFDDK